MTARERLPNRRRSENFTFEFDGLRFTATVSRFPDGRVGELFLNNHKAGNQVDTNARDAAILLSFALQHGADVEAIRKAVGLSAFRLRRACAAASRAVIPPPRIVAISSAVMARLIRIG